MWVGSPAEHKQIQAIAKTAYEFGQKSADTLPKRVCKTLEGITLLEMDETPLGSMVYRFCHLANGTCENPHEDWLASFEKTEAEIAAACASPNQKKQAFYDSIEVGTTYWITYDDPDYPCNCPCHRNASILHCVPCCHDMSYTGPARCVEKLDDKQQCVFEDPRQSLHRYVLDPYSIRELTDEEKTGLREQLKFE